MLITSLPSDFFAAEVNDLYALDRKKMLNGEPATFVHFLAGAFSLLPADLDGRRPPIGTPAPFVQEVDSERGGGVDRLEVYEFRVNFADPGSSTFSLVAELPTDPFSAVL